MNERFNARGICKVLGAALIVGSLGMPLAAETKEAPPPVEIGDKIALDPMLSRHLGKQATVIVFIGTGCPVSNAYLPHLNELAKKYDAKGVRFIGVNANAQDSADEVAKHAKEFAIAFPVVKDESQRVADALGARRVPEAAVLDAQDKLRYCGRIDDRYGVTGRKDQATREDLALALDELLAGKAITVTKTEVAGCLIGRVPQKAAQPITYSNQVVRIFQNKCQTCHRPEGVAPFSLTSYDQAQAWSKTIKEVVVERRMPPWHADPHYGKFANDRSLSQDEIDTLIAWIDGGAAKGQDADLPVPAEFPKGKWTIGTPDVVLAMPKEFTVPAKGVLPYQDFVVETNFKEDRWVERAQILPGSKSVHHAVVFLQGTGDQWLCAYVPGDSPLVLSPGTAKKIPAGAKLRFNLHYTPTGKVETDRTSLGLVFAKEPPKTEIRHHMLDKKDIQIPAGAANHREEKAFPVPHDMKVVSFFPHMHTRGKSWECRVLYPNGRTETVLSVPRYDFNWQHTYRCAEPLLLPAGSKIQCIAHYDNSKNNPANPDPSQAVKWGPQTWDEMMVCGLEYLVESRQGTGPAATNVGVVELPRDQAVRAAKGLSAEVAKLGEQPIRLDVDVEKAAGLLSGQRAVLVIPDKRLTQAVVDEANGDVIPVGQLWLKDWGLEVEGKALAPEKRQTVSVNVGSQRHRLGLYLLGLRKNADGKMELLLFAKAKEPLLAIPLQRLDGRSEAILGVAIKEGEQGANLLALSMAGKYQTVLTLVPLGP